MENPSTWTKAHNIIHKAHSCHHKQSYDLKIPGRSLESTIVSELKKAGYLTSEALEIIGYQHDKDIIVQPYEEGF